MVRDWQTDISNLDLMILEGGYLYLSVVVVLRMLECVEHLILKSYTHFYVYVYPNITHSLIPKQPLH